MQRSAVTDRLRALRAICVCCPERFGANYPNGQVALIKLKAFRRHFDPGKHHLLAFANFMYIYMNARVNCLGTSASVHEQTLRHP